MNNLITSQKTNFKKFSFIAVAIMILGFLVLFFARDINASLIRLDPRTTRRVDAHGFCRDVTNNNDTISILVPFLSDDEWFAFRQWRPAWVALPECPSPAPSPDPAPPAPAPPAPGPTPAPTATISANPTSVASGGTTTLFWSSTNATSCTATAGSGFSTGGLISGSDTSNALTSGTTFTVSCTGAGGTVQQSVTVTISTPLIITNSNSGISCSEVCTNNGRVCTSIGTNTEANNGNIMRASGPALTCTQYFRGGAFECGEIMWTTWVGAICEGIRTTWTRCRCQ